MTIIYYCNKLIFIRLQFSPNQTAIRDELESGLG